MALCDRFDGQTGQGADRGQLFLQGCCVRVAFRRDGAADMANDVFADVLAHRGVAAQFDDHIVAEGLEAFACASGGQMAVEHPAETEIQLAAPTVLGVLFRPDVWEQVAFASFAQLMQHIHVFGHMRLAQLMDRVDLNGFNKEM